MARWWNLGSAGDSNIATGHLLQKVTYPDSSSGSDVVTFAYNALSEQVGLKTRWGHVVQTDYDTAGRATQTPATTIVSGFDDAVKRVVTAYVSAVLSDAGKVREWGKYCAYGVPFSITPADFNGGGFESGDDDEFDAAHNGGAGAPELISTARAL